ncbi:MAG: hypothetical protein GY861_15050 [bacterium]|nr:hypothetical protein [bacterium]
MVKLWEQSEVPVNIPVYNIEFQLTTQSFIALHVRGDQHLGLKGLDLEQLELDYKREQDTYRNHILVLDTGDWLECNNKTSVGHGQDVLISDTTIQMNMAKEFQDRVDQHLYGTKRFKSMKACSRKVTKHARRVGVIGNHEYRVRKNSGIWLNTELYSGKGVIDAGIHCILSVTLINKKLKLSKNYRIYLAHRLSNSGGVSLATLLRSFDKKKGDVDADIYVCGHYHKKLIIPGVKYTSAGKKKKIMYVCNPAAFDNTEYARWAQYSPIESNSFAQIYLPIGATENIKGTV